MLQAGTEKLTMTTRLLNVGELCERYGIARTTLRRLMLRGKVPLTPLRVGRQLRFRPEDVEAVETLLVEVQADRPAIGKPVINS